LYFGLQHLNNTAMAHKPSKYQQAIYDTFQKTDKNMVISAVAGSGKTTTIVNLTELIKPGLFAIFLAFNKSIANELRSKIPSRIEVKTLHANGYNELRFKYGRLPGVDMRTFLDEGKIGKIVMRHVDEWGDWEDEADKMSYASRVEKIVDVMRFSLATRTDELQDLCYKHGIDLLNGEIDAARQVLAEANSMNTTFDFTDMIYRPAIGDWRLKQFHVIIVDECQDLNRAQQEMIRKMLKPGGRLVAVGDKCQPAGTLVSVVRRKSNRWQKNIIERIPIENLNTEDRVVSLDTRSGVFIMGRKIEGITKRKYNGEMVVVSMHDNIVSKYTINHHCIVNMSSLKNKWCVYLMRKGEAFRIGMSKMDYKTVGSGPSARMRAEKADDMWILDVYDTKKECMLMEKAISGKFGIPEITFEANKSKNILINFDADTLNFIWSYVMNGINLRDRAELCLTSFGRSINYPLHSVQNSLNINYTIKRPIIIYACNILDGSLMLPFNDECGVHFKASSWSPIKITREFYAGDVYSLTIEKNHMYVADGIVTHNCQSVYGFAGADIESFDRLKRMLPNTVELPLSCCYRCDSAIIEHAKEIIPWIEAREGAGDGSVRVGSVAELVENDMVLCRNTRPLVSLCMRLIAQGKKATIKGADIGKSLAAMVSATKRKTLDAAFNKMFKELGKLEQKARTQFPTRKPEEVSYYANYQDKIEALKAIAESRGCKTPEQLCSEIEGIFVDDTAGIVLSTMHKAKGLESDRVFIIERFRLPAPFATQEWEHEQESNLDYVARTRAKKLLVYVEDFCSDAEKMKALKASIAEFKSN
jgi:soluble cytochrome b562